MENNNLQIPGWKVVRTIGHGSVGTVYEVMKDEEFGNGMRSAMKVISVPESKEEIANLRNEGYDDASLAELFKSRVEDLAPEFRLMNKLKGCSNIVSFEDHLIIPHKDDPGYDVYIRMELLTSLSEYLWQNFGEDPVPDAVVLKLGVDMCNALELCSNYHVIHRDIKPMNIFANEHGDFKLGDFGSARTEEESIKASKAGTFAYMAPEMYLGKPYQANIDLYSLGMVMYWALNERRGPFLPLPPAVPKSADHAESTARRMRGDRLPAPANGSEELKRIVLKACEFDPEERYGDPAEMRRDLIALSAKTAGVSNWQADTRKTGWVEPDEPEEKTVGANRDYSQESRTIYAKPDPQPDRYEEPQPRTEERSEYSEDSMNATVAGMKRQPEKPKKDPAPERVREQEVKEPAENKAAPKQPEEPKKQEQEKKPKDKKPAEPKKRGMKKGLLIALIAGGATFVLLIAAIVGVFFVVRNRMNTLVPSPTYATAEPAETIKIVPESPTVSAGRNHTVALTNGGRVVSIGENTDGRCDVSGWEDIVAVSAGYQHTVGLKSDGTVVAAGSDEFGQCSLDPNEWYDIVAISAGNRHTVGVRKDGTAVAVGSNPSGQCDVSDWTDIVAVSAGGNFTVGLKKDGTVVATGLNDYGQCDVSDWTDIVSISAGWAHTVGLKKDGTVVATGKTEFNQCNVTDWTNIVAVAAGGGFTLGLREDGVAVAVGYSKVDVPFPYMYWTDIVAISAGGFHGAALRKDGTVVAIGDNQFSQCNVSGWTDIRIP